jgi:MFS family permease
MWLPVLRNRDFRRLWTASAIDSFGSWLLVMAVPLHVFALTGSAMSTGLALAVQAAPAVLIGPWAGVVVDRWDRKKVLVLADIASAAAVSLMMPATTPGGLVFIYVGLALENVGGCFLAPALGAVTPSIVGRGADLAAANSLSAFTGSAFRMVGPLVGTFLVAGGWFPAVVLVDAASYLVAAAVISRVAVPRAASRAPVAVPRAASRAPVAVPRAASRAPVAVPRAASRAPVAVPRAASRAPVAVPRNTDGLRHGLRHIVRTPLLRGLLITSWSYWTLNAALTVLLIPFVAVRLHSSGRTLGYLIAGLGAGYLGGSALSRILVHRYPARVILVAAYASVGACFLVLFTATALPIAIVAVTAAGVPGAVVQIAVGQFRQTSTPDAVLGRVSAVFATSDRVAAVAGALVAPAVVALTGLAAALDSLSILVLVTAATAVIVLPGTERVRPGRRLTRHTEG